MTSDVAFVAIIAALLAVVVALLAALAVERFRRVALAETVAAIYCNTSPGDGHPLEYSVRESVRSACLSTGEIGDVVTVQRWSEEQAQTAFLGRALALARSFNGCGFEAAVRWLAGGLAVRRASWHREVSMRFVRDEHGAMSLVFDGGARDLRSDDLSADDWKPV